MRTLIAILLLSTQTSNAASLGCSGPGNWAASSAYVQLKNAGLMTNENTNFKRTKVVLLSQSKIGKNLYQQVHRIEFFDNSGQSTTVITTNKASNEECSMSEVDVYVVSKKLDN